MIFFEPALKICFYFQVAFNLTLQQSSLYALKSLKDLGGLELYASKSMLLEKSKCSFQCGYWQHSQHHCHLLDEVRGEVQDNG